MTSRDILYAIAEHIKPDPIVFTRLAAVNKDFYAVFTSDKVWAPWDVYELGSGIFADFIERLPGFEGLLVNLRYFRVSNDNLDAFTALKSTVASNKYVETVLAHSVYMFDGYKVLPIDNKSQLRLMIRLDKFVFRILSAEAHDDEELALLACREYLQNFAHISPRLKAEERFRMQLLKSYLHPRDHNGPTNMDEDETWMELFRLQPWVFLELIKLFDNSSFFRNMQLADLDREMVLSVVKREPEVLDILFEYWGDKEFCLAAIESWPSIAAPDSRPYLFLVTCDEGEVLEAVRRLLPYSIGILSSSFADRKELFIRHLQQVDEDDFTFWYTVEKDRTTFFTDSRVIAIILDRKLLSRYEWEPECPQFDDYDWIKERITRNPEAWVFASDRLKGDKDLLMYTLGKYCHGRKIIDIKFDLIPKSLQEDPEIHRLLANICGLEKNLPRRFWTPDLVFSYCETFPGYVPSFEPDQYELARELVLRNIKYIRATGQFATRFMKDPRIFPHMCTHQFETWVYLQLYDSLYFEDKKRGDAIYDLIFEQSDQELKYPELTREVALRFFDHFPFLYTSNQFWNQMYGEDENLASKRWFGKDFVAELVKIKPDIFMKLPKEFVFDPDLQELSRSRFSSDTCPTV